MPIQLSFKDIQLCLEIESFMSDPSHNKQEYIENKMKQFRSKLNFELMEVTNLLYISKEILNTWKKGDVDGILLLMRKCKFDETMVHAKQRDLDWCTVLIPQLKST